MLKDALLDLYKYNNDANAKLWTCVEKLSDEQFKYPLTHSIGSVKNHVIHMLGVEYWWFKFLSEGVLDFVSSHDLYPTRESIWEKWQEVAENNIAYIDQCNDEELTRRVKPEFWDDDEGAIMVHQAILQVINHATDHRAQVMAGLHQLQGETFGQDYLNYLHGE